MLNENAKKWVETLRSGRFEQGKKWLCVDGKYCCLGVACELAIESGILLTKTNEYHMGGSHVVYHAVNTVFSDSGNTTVLPRAVQDWLGLRTEQGTFSRDGFSSLAAKNDLGLTTFSEIADIIESEPDGLFTARD